jgi:predicted CopG family antitoxin
MTETSAASENDIYAYPLCVPMTIMNIAIRKEAYDFLSSMKRDGMSFSDVILGFKKENCDIMRFFGALKDVDWEAREKEMRDFRKSFNRRMSQDDRA